MKTSQITSQPIAGQQSRKPPESDLICLSPSWDKHLPDAWMDAVDAPLYFEQYSEYEIIADRTVGYDADGLPCFTSHRFTLTGTAPDITGEPHEVATYSEEMAAWRLRDERWLIFRAITTHPCNMPRGFYAISPDMPR